VPLVSKAEIFSPLALASGKNVLLVGAPGVGKTRLAKQLAGEGMPAYEVVTCREGLTYDRLVAFYSAKGDKVSLELGPLARSVLRYWLSIASKPMSLPGWIVLDEVNRVNIDVVLGEIFTAMDMEHRMGVKILGEDLLKTALDYLDGSVEVVAKRLDMSVDRVRSAFNDLKMFFEWFGGVPLPFSYRFIATMNIYDRAQLYRLGHAFVRRFAYIYMPPPYESYSVSWGTDQEKELLRNEVSKGVYAMLTTVDSEVVKQASRELKMNRYVVEVRKVMPAEVASLLTGVDNPTVYISPRFIDLDAKIPEVVKPGSYCDKAFKLVSHIYGFAEDVGIELGTSLLVDVVKMCVVAGAARYNKIVSDAELADFIASSIVLPQLGVIAPRLRAEALLGSEDLLKKVRGMRDYVKKLLGDKSLSYRVLRGLVES
jgi:5-methylcytosine-specific restriction protein B